MSRFAGSWLGLREPVDAAARDAALGKRFAAALPKRPRLLDFGAGTGANARAIAPLIGGDQDWVLVDNDRTLLARQAACFRAWAEADGRPAWIEEDGTVAVSAGAGTWRFQGLRHDLGAGLPAMAADGVTCAAFLDIASAGWLARLADRLAARPAPFLATLTIDGRRHWSPPHPADRVVAAAFARHQEIDKGLGPAAGTAAADILAALLAAPGLVVTRASSDWCLDGRHQALVAALVRGEAAAALAAAPGAAAAIAGWRRQRLHETAAGTLAITIGHCDLLSLTR